MEASWEEESQVSIYSWVRLNLWEYNDGQTKLHITMGSDQVKLE